MRGLNDGARRSTVRSVVVENKCSVVCLQETKLNVISNALASQFLGPNISMFHYLPADGTRGGVLLGWDPTVVDCSDVTLNEFFLSALLSFVDGGSHGLTIVYGPQAEQDKIRFLQELRDSRAAIPGEWLLVGDFNLIYQDSDKNNGNLHRRMMGRFRRVLDDLELQEIHLNGRAFTGRMVGAGRH